jgi:hypothetical protein
MHIYFHSSRLSNMGGVKQQLQLELSNSDFNGNHLTSFGRIRDTKGGRSPLPRVQAIISRAQVDSMQVCGRECGRREVRRGARPRSRSWMQIVLESFIIFLGFDLVLVAARGPSSFSSLLPWLIIKSSSFLSLQHELIMLMVQISLERTYVPNVRSLSFLQRGPWCL